MKKTIITLIFTLCMTFGIFAQKGKKTIKEKHQHSEISAVLKEDAKDPICKMSVAKGTKDVSVYQGKQFGFCSVVCKEMFDKNPKKYAVVKH
ncbi:MAG: YHS domain-containing protein [Bacteroidota bacterium]